MIIETAIQSFLRNIAYMEHSVHTLKAYKQDLKQWHQCIDKEELNAITFNDFESYLSFLHQSSLKTATLRRKRVVVHRFLKYCYDKRFCEERLYELIDPIKSKNQKKPKDVLTNLEIKLLLDYIQSEIDDTASKAHSSSYTSYLYYMWIRNRLLTYILLYTGCRAQEAVSIRKIDINKEQNTLTILAKGGKYNSIPIHEELFTALVAYEQQVTLIGDEEICQLLTESIYLFPSKDCAQKHLSTRTLYDLMLKYSKLLGRHIHAHIFRHTFASYCIAANMDITTISSLISHSNPSITLSIYTHEIESNQKHKEMKKLTFNHSDV